MCNNTNMRTKLHIAKAAGISVRHLRYLIVAERQPTTRVAIRLERVTGIPKEIWAFGNKEDRMAAWDDFEATA